MQKTVRTPVANLYRSHTFMSDQVTQALMGETVEVLDSHETWFKVRQWDNYESWIHGFYLMDVDDTPADTYFFDRHTSQLICDDGSEIDVIITTTSGTPTFNVEYVVGINSRLASNIGYQYIINTNQAGVYSVTKATDSKGCISKSISGNATVNINPMPEANIIAYPQPADITNPLIYFIDQSLFHVSGVWDFGDGNTALSNFDKIAHTFKDTGTYIVALEVMTDSGCVVTAYQTIIIDPAFIIYIPTAFTPNNDLYNDYFLPIVDGINEYEFSIYDRFGNRVFNTDKTNEAWDGKVNNGTEYATAGHYVYNIILIDFRGKERTFQGGLMLIR